MDRAELLRLIFENSDVIISSLLWGLETSEDRIKFVENLWKLLMMVTPPQTLYYLIYHFYQLHPEEFLRLIENHKDRIKEILK